jgi:hypothetical protein
MSAIAVLSAACGGMPPTQSHSCLEQYSLESLSMRDFAFDGTVKSVTLGSRVDEVLTPDRVTFTVTESFKGGIGSEITLESYEAGAGATSAGAPSFAIGTRLLVAGMADKIWLCGFTQPYQADVAAQRKQKLSAR